MLDGMFQLCDPCIQMRILAGLQRMLHGRFRASQEWTRMTLFAMVSGFLGKLDGILTMLILSSHDITSRPTLAEYRMEWQQCGSDEDEECGEHGSSWHSIS